MSPSNGQVAAKSQRVEHPRFAWQPEKKSSGQPPLVVFVGGTGNRVGQAMRADSVFPNAQFVFLDTDPDRHGIPAEHFVSLSVPTSESIVSNRRRYSAIDQILPAKVTQTVRADAGSGMVRYVTGGIAIPFFQFLIRKHFQRLVDAVLEHPVGGDRPPVEAHFVFSIAGGCGSGAFSLVPILIDLFRLIHPGIRVDATLHVITPDAFHNRHELESQAKLANANAMASLKEIELAITDPSFLHLDALGVRWTPGQPLVKRCLFYSSTNELMQKITDHSLFDVTATAIAAQLNPAITSLNQSREKNNDLFKPSNIYGGARAEIFRYPRSAVNKALLWMCTKILLSESIKTKLNASAIADIAHEIVTTQVNDALGLLDAFPQCERLDDGDAWALGDAKNLRTQVELIGSWYSDEYVQAIDKVATDVMATINRELRERVHQLLTSPENTTPSSTAAILEQVARRIKHESAATTRQLKSSETDPQKIDFKGLLEKYDALKATRFRKAQKIALVDQEARELLTRYIDRIVRRRQLNLTLKILAKLETSLGQWTRVAKQIDTMLNQAEARCEQEVDDVLSELRPHSQHVALAVDEEWLNEQSEKFLKEVAWLNSVAPTFWSSLPLLVEKDRLTQVLNRDVWPQMRKLIAEHFGKINAFSQGLATTCVEWFTRRVDRTVPQFPFIESNCFGQPTALKKILLVASEKRGHELMRSCQCDSLEIAESGDDDEIILYVQRRWVPLEAAIPNLEQLEADYEHFVTAEAPLELHTTERFSQHFASKQKNGSDGSSLRG